MSDASPLLWFGVFAIVVYLLFRVVTFGGVRAAMFGARIERTVGEALGNGSSLTNTEIRVHVLDGAPDKAVGLELVAKSFASYQMTPVTLSLAQATNLLRLLEDATTPR